MDPAKPIAALDPPGPQWDRVGRLTGSALLDPLVRPGVIVVIDVLSQDLLQVPAASGIAACITNNGTFTIRS